MYSQFKLGYWSAKKAWVLEGKAGLEKKWFPTSDSVGKYIEIVDSSGLILSSTRATNTNWYEKMNYDGYQVLLGESELGSLNSGGYKVQVKLVVDGKEYVSPVKENSLGRIIFLKIAKFQEINEYTILNNFIDFSSSNGECILTVHAKKKIRINYMNIQIKKCSYL